MFHVNKKLFSGTFEELSYVVGFIQTDGHLSGTRGTKGRLSIEISDRDVDILEKISERIPFYYSIKSRDRVTNFGKIRESKLSVYDMEFRNYLCDLGVPYGRKSEIVSPPKWVDPSSYIRGLIDGDGSLGFTTGGHPFVSIVTSSHDVADYYKSFLKKYTGVLKNDEPNARDHVYNISIFKEDAVNICKVLYLTGCLCLERKRKMAEDVVKWVRPVGMRRQYRKKVWTPEEDVIVRSLSFVESSSKLGRTLSSVKTRRYRLDNDLIPVR